MRHATTSRDFFDAMYQRNPDPWNFESSPYEKGRYSAILNALEGRHYLRAFEPGCSVGILTQALASYCDWLDAVDISPTAVLRASQRCKHLPNIHIQCGSLPEAIPDCKFDLVVFSEIGYYFEREELRTIIRRLSDGLSCGGVLLAVHWLGTSSDHLLGGDEVHDIIRENDNLYLDSEEHYPLFRLDRMVSI